MSGLALYGQMNGEMYVKERLNRHTLSGLVKHCQKRIVEVYTNRICFHSETRDRSMVDSGSRFKLVLNM